VGKQMKMVGNKHENLAWKQYEKNKNKNNPIKYYYDPSPKHISAES